MKGLLITCQECQSRSLSPHDFINHQQALQEMGCELRVFEPSNKIKACLTTAKGMIGVVLQVYLPGGSGAPSMVEVSNRVTVVHTDRC